MEEIIKKRRKKIKRIIKEWHGSVRIGIWRGKWTLKVYEDMAVLRMPREKWIVNNGTRKKLATRITKYPSDSQQYQTFLVIAKEETDRIFAELIY